MGKTQGFRFDSAAVERFGVRFRQCFRRAIGQLGRKNKGVSATLEADSVWKESKTPMFPIDCRQSPHQKRRGYGRPTGLIGTKRGHKSNVFRCRR